VFNKSKINLPKNPVLWIWIICAGIHLALSLVYAQITPYRSPGVLLSYGGIRIPDVGAPDERAHADYVQDLLTGEGLPYLNIDRMEHDSKYRADQYENHQPPLYYLADAAWGRIAGVQNVDDTNAVRLRYLNCLIGSITVVGVVLLAFFSTNSRAISAGAGIFAAMLPSNVALSGAVSNDPLLFCLSTWVIVVCVRSIIREWRPIDLLLVFILTALSILTKTSGVALIPCVVFAFLLKSPIVSQSRFNWKWLGIGCAAFMALIIPLLLRNIHTYGDPFAFNAFNLAFQDTAQPGQIVHGGASNLTYWTSWVGWWTARSFVGVFGYMDIWLNSHGTPFSGSGAPNILYRVALAIFVILIFSSVIACTKRFVIIPRGVTLIQIFFALITAVLFLRFNLQFFQAQARYLLPAIGPISVGAGIGLVWIFQRQKAIGLTVFFLSLCYLQFVSINAITSGFEKRTMAMSGSTGNLQNKDRNCYISAISALDLNQRSSYANNQDFVKNGEWCQLS